VRYWVPPRLEKKSASPISHPLGMPIHTSHHMLQWMWLALVDGGVMVQGTLCVLVQVQCCLNRSAHNGLCRSLHRLHRANCR